MDELRDTQYNLPIGTDCISRRKLLDKFEPWLEVHDYNDGERNVIKAVLYEIKCMPPATDNNVATRDCISRQAAIDVCDNVIDLFRGQFGAGVVVAIKESIEELPSAQPATDTNVGIKLGTDLISRQAAIDALDEQIEQCDKALSSFDISMKDAYAVKVERASLVAFRETLEYMPSVQPERTCVNCGRTVNNGGWYADGRTRCPIEEHYALPKDGFCHLWEKRNVTDDDYPERREE